jgi:uncharacterized membrane protein
LLVGASLASILRMSHADARPVEAPRQERLPALDVLRGLVMVVMALDHTRDYFHDFQFDPLDLSRTTPAIFFTRWITHFCAPVFVFIAGTGAYLYGSRHTRGELSRFLWTRGLWLVFLELTWVRFSWSFDPDLRHGGLQVIWVLGVSMIVLAALVYLPLWVITTLGVLVCATHNLLDPFDAVRPDQPSFLWGVLHQQSRFGDWDGWGLGIRYPLIPWIGVMAAGYGFGAMMLLPREVRRRSVMKLGLALTALFVVIRAVDVYGDSHHWSRQSSALFTVLSFIDTTKYPPSLDYLLMTIGPALVFLSLMDRDLPAIWKPIQTIGRVPMFFYLLHIPLIHASSLVVDYLRNGPRNLGQNMFEAPENWGFGLPGVYLAWFLIVLALYFPCRWFAGVKLRSRAAWLSYL